MTTKKATSDDSIRISIQIDGKKTARVQCIGSITAAELRDILLIEKVQLPRNSQFLDAQDYPVLVAEEKLLKINNLITSTEDDNIIKLRTIESTTKVDNQSSTTATVPKKVIPFLVILFLAFFLNTSNGELFIHNRLCPIFIQFNISVLFDRYQCSINNSTNKNTTDYLLNQMKNMDSGIKVLVSNKNSVAEIEPKTYNQEYVTMINDWVNNRSMYQKDYAWYNTMKSPSGDCERKFNERVEFSMKDIKDTVDSIEKFSGNAFKDWPQNLIDRIDLINQINGIENINDDAMSFEYNGQIRDNMYLVAWRRNKDTIRIQTYITIFERKAGYKCKFDEDFWSNNRERINNAKKYFLLLKIESNPVYKEFLLKQRQIE